MSIESKMEIRDPGSGRRELLSLEKTGKYVFHGSPDRIEILEPRQAVNKGENDGNPAIFATPHTDTAIFRSLINDRNVTGDSESKFGIDDKKGGLYFEATQNLIDNARGKIGKVYILDKKDFFQFEGTQCITEKTIKPIRVIEVNYDDLPDYIKIIE